MNNPRNTIHHVFEPNRDLLLDLLCLDAGPLRDAPDLIVRDVRVSFHWKSVEGSDPPTEEHQATRQHQQALVQGEVNDGANHLRCFVRGLPPNRRNPESEISFCPC